MMVELPYPRLVGATAEEQMKELLSYLIQLNEALEFVLMNISMENLSPELINKLNSLGADIEQANADRQDELAQIRYRPKYSVDM